MSDQDQPYYDSLIEPPAHAAPLVPASGVVRLTGEALPEHSPRWSNNMKLVVGLTVAAVFLALFIYFRNIVGPVLLALILAFLIQPVALRMAHSGRLSWRASVNLIYLVLLVALIGIGTVTGLALLQQAQSAFSYVENFVTSLPATLDTLSHQTYVIGPFHFGLTGLDLGAVARQVLDLVRPLLGEAGSLLTGLASGTASAAGWTFFILLVSYFLLAESNQWSSDLVRIDVPGYAADFQRLVAELVNTWRAFLRGQFTIAVMIVISYYLLLTALGTRLSLVIALTAGAAAFIPYVGAFIAWVLTAIIAYFQVGNYFGLTPFWYTVLVVGCCLLLNQVFDNLVSPRIMGSALGVHPAGVLIAAIVATDLLGFVGLMLAAPVLATVTILWRYITRKMLDLDPWGPTPPRPPPAFSWNRMRAAGRWALSRMRTRRSGS